MLFIKQSQKRGTFMRKNGKKLVAVLLIGVMMAGSFAACNGKESQGETPGPTAGVTSAPSEQTQNTPAPTSTTVPTPTTAPTAAPTQTPVVKEEAPEFDSWDGIVAESTGSLNGQAKLVGEGIRVVPDENGNLVVKLSGRESYLELPKDIYALVSDGFSIAFRYQADATTDSTANVLQTNLCGFGVGDVQWRDAPELSLKLNGTLRVYVGGRTINGVYNPYATYNNGISGVDALDYAEPGGHKTRYEAMTMEMKKGEWHQVVISVSSSELHLYVDGKEVAVTAGSADYNLASTLDYLFSKTEDGSLLLTQYINTTFGNSVYHDTPDFKGMVDDIRVYHEALSLADVEANKVAPVFAWDFSAASLKEAQAEEAETVDLTMYRGETKVTEVTELKVASPDGKTVVQFWKDEAGSFYYSVTDEGKVVIATSLLGMELKEGNLYQNLALVSGSVEEKHIDETYELYTGPQAVMENLSNEKSFTLKNTVGSFTLKVSVHNDGFAYRYVDVMAGSAKKITVVDEKSEVILPTNNTTWAFELNGTYEGTYVKRNNEQLTLLSQKMSTPMLAETGNCWLMFTEASAINNDGEYCTSALQTRNGDASMKWSFGLKRDPNRESTGELDSPGHVTIKEVTTVNGFTTPWRATVVTSDLNELVTSSLITDLNPEADETLYADTSYIKPGKVAWSWWSESDAQGVYNKHIEYIDFAAEQGWEYVCLDAYWRNFERNLPELCAYAAEKNVGIFVWVNYRDMKTEAEMEKLFSSWKAAGVVGLKTDYFESDDTDVLLVMQRVAECSAKHQLMVLYHGCVRPGGECRTYPNILSTEAVLGEECHKWSENPNLPNCLLYTFTRNICGSMDYTPAGTKVDSEASYGFCLAQTIVYESALQHFAYAAASYRSYNGLALLNHVPTEWDESRLVNGYPGKYVTMARRNGENWFFGSMTEYERTMEISLGFLGEGTYNAYIYEDKADGTGLVYRVETVTAKDVITLQLCDGGGAAGMITKETIDTSVGENEAVNPSGYTYYEAENEANILNGAAVRSSSAFCAGGQKVGYIGYSGNTLIFTNVEVPEDGTYKMLVTYCSGENRRVTVTVNNDAQYTIKGMNSGDFVHTAVIEVEIELKQGTNTIEFANPTYYAPDIDRIAICDTKVK